MPQTIGSYQLSTAARDHHALAMLQGAQSKPGGVTLDFSGVAAESADRTLMGGLVVKAGQKVIEAGTVVFRAGGTNNAFAPAIDTTTLVRGDCFILDTHQIEVAGRANVADAYDGGRFFYSRLKIGGTSQPTVANFNAAFPAVTYVKD